MKLMEEIFGLLWTTIVQANALPTVIRSYDSLVHLSVLRLLTSRSHKFAHAMYVMYMELMTCAASIPQSIFWREEVQYSLPWSYVGEEWGIARHMYRLFGRGGCENLFSWAVRCKFAYPASIESLGLKEVANDQESDGDQESAADVDDDQGSDVEGDDDQRSDFEVSQRWDFEVHAEGIFFSLAWAIDLFPLEFYKGRLIFKYTNEYVSFGIQDWGFGSFVPAYAFPQDDLHITIGYNPGMWRICDQSLLCELSRYDNVEVFLIPYCIARTGRIDYNTKEEPFNTINRANALSMNKDGTPHGARTMPPHSSTRSLKWNGQLRCDERLFSSGNKFWQKERDPFKKATDPWIWGTLSDE